MALQRTFVLRGRSGTNGNVFGLNLFRPEAGVVRELPLEKLKVASMADEAALFRAAHDYARESGFASAYPTFSGREGATVNVVLLRAEIVTPHEVLRRELGGSLEDLADLFIAIRDYALEHQFRHGYPTLHRQGSGSEARYRVLLFPGAGMVSNTEMSVEPGWRPWDSVALSFRRAHEFALKQGFLSGIPNFRHKDNGDELAQSEAKLNELLLDGWHVVSVTPMGSVGTAKADDAGAFYSAAVFVLER